MLEDSWLHLVCAGHVQKLLGVRRFFHQLPVARTVSQRERQELKEPQMDERHRLATSQKRARRTDPLLALRHRVDRYGLPLQLWMEHLLSFRGVET